MAWVGRSPSLCGLRTHGFSNGSGQSIPPSIRPPKSECPQQDMMFSRLACLWRGTFCPLDVVLPAAQCSQLFLCHTRPLPRPRPYPFQPHKPVDLAMALYGLGDGRWLHNGTAAAGYTRSSAPPQGTGPVASPSPIEHWLNVLP
jgi:hypothetical protein